MAERTELIAARLQRNWTQEQAADLAGVSVRAYRGWEHGTVLPRASSVQRLCAIFEQDADALGLLEHIVHDTIQAPLLSTLLVQDLTLRLLLLTFTRHQTPGELQRSAGLILEESMTDPITRREALSRLVALVVAPLAAPPLSGAAIETTLTRCSAAIVACRELGQGQDVSLALEGAKAIQQNVVPLMGLSPQYRVPAATLAAQAGILITVFGRHLEGPQASVAYGQQTVSYAQASGDKAMLILAHETLAWSYYHMPNATAALRSMEQSIALMKSPKIPLYMHGPAYGALAIMQAAQGLPSAEAFRQSEKMAFADQSYAYFVDNPVVTLIRNDAELAYQQKQHEKTVSTLTTHLIDEKTLRAKKYAVSEREHVRALSLVAMASLKAKNKDLERSVALWKPWIQSAKALNSKLCFDEAVNAYHIMDALWGNDTRVQALRPLTIQ